VSQVLVCNETKSLLLYLYYFVIVLKFFRWLYKNQFQTEVFVLSNKKWSILRYHSCSKLKLNLGIIILPPTPQINTFNCASFLRFKYKYTFIDSCVYFLRASPNVLLYHLTAYYQQMCNHYIVSIHLCDAMLFFSSTWWSVTKMSQQAVSTDTVIACATYIWLEYSIWIFLHVTILLVRGNEHRKNGVIAIDFGSYDYHYYITFLIWTKLIYTSYIFTPFILLAPFLD